MSPLKDLPAAMPDARIQTGRKFPNSSVPQSVTGWSG
jgi:hypothetical protein